MTTATTVSPHFSPPKKSGSVRPPPAARWRARRSGVVLDASALAAVIFGEPDARLIAAAIARQVWTVSTFLVEFEVRSVGLVKARRGELSFEDVERLLRDAVFPPSRSFDSCAAFTLARVNELTYYDAAYLQLAIERDALLFTLDRKLLETDPARCVDPSLGWPGADGQSSLGLPPRSLRRHRRAEPGSPARGAAVRIRKPDAGRTPALPEERLTGGVVVSPTKTRASVSCRSLACKTLWRFALP